MNTPTPLLRSLSLLEISFYGIGTIIGAGIYVLLGAVVGESDLLAPWSCPLAGSLVLVFALWLPVTTLARITNSLIRVVFTLLNLSLLSLRYREHQRSPLQLGIPALGTLLCIGFLLVQVWS